MSSLRSLSPCTCVEVFGGYRLVAASAIASCVSGLPHVTSKSSGEEEKENFLARV